MKVDVKLDPFTLRALADDRSADAAWWMGGEEPNRACLERAADAKEDARKLRSLATRVETMRKRGFV